MPVTARGGGRGMRVAVAGATGLAGAAVCAALESERADVVPLSRSHGVDLISGAGLERMRGCDVVIDATNVTGGDLPRDVATVTAAERLVEAAVEHGVRRVAVLSILGVDDPGFDEFPYYRAKREQERLALASPLEAVIVRSAQWFEFAMNPAAVTTADEGYLEVADWLIQPVAVSSVGCYLARSALKPNREVVSIAGPEPVRLPEMTRRILSTRGDPRQIRAVEARVAAFSSGALLPDAYASLLDPRLNEWLVN